MISINRVQNAAHALQYFSRDNYYTQNKGLEESAWLGEGARILGLSGQIRKEDFFALLNGKVQGQELGKWVKNSVTNEPERDHRPGIDITFSAPKSVSILAEVYGIDEIRNAHEKAVKAAVSFIEKELITTRQTYLGKTESIKTNNLIAAAFKHNTSRDLDPQTHTHVILMNMTKREDGQWRSVSNDDIYLSQRTIGAIYTSELANQLQMLGYEIQRTGDKGNFEIAGITREQIQQFSQRRVGIEESLKKRGINIKEATAEQKERATLLTRSHKKNVDHCSVLGSWKEKASTLGINISAICEKLGQTKSLHQITGHQAMAFAVAHLFEREAVVDKNKLFSTAIEHGVGRVSFYEIQKAFDHLEKSGEITQLPTGEYTTKAILSTEKWSVAQVQAEKQATDAIAVTETLERKIQQLERQNNFPYTKGQKDAIKLVLTSRDRYVAIQGLAGTGKTTMLKALRCIAQEYGYVVRAMAPTGAASQVLAKETGIFTDTVSMFQIKEAQLQRDLKLALQYAPDHQRKKELWIVDESSFLSLQQKSRLDMLGQRADAKIVYLGDTLQLQAVEAGKPFEQAQQYGIETAYMTEINRQKTPDLKQAVDIITGRADLAGHTALTQVELKHNARAFTFLDKAGYVSETQEAITTLVEHYMSLSPDERARTNIITAYNDDRRKINEQVRCRLKAEGVLASPEQNYTILVSAQMTKAEQAHVQYYQMGHVVRFNRHYKVIDANNGEYMRVVNIHPAMRQIELQRSDGSRIVWQPHKHNKVEVYREENRVLSENDQIRFTRNADDIKNGNVGKVISLSGNVALLEMSTGPEFASMQLDLSKNRHWEYGYASTVHSAQGATSYRTLFHIHTPGKGEELKSHEITKMAKIFGQRSFYVGSTRASHELQIFTTDKQFAERLITAKQDKTSGMELIDRCNIIEK